MIIAGFILLAFTFFAAFVAAQFFFYRYTKRIFWRAFMPLALRKTLLPDDTIKMDVFTVIEEYIALFLVGSFMMLPIIAISSMGFLSVF
jgi:hypothetical protein